MSHAPYRNLESFERAIENLIEKADSQNRGADLDRVYGHLRHKPAEMGTLATLMFLLDDDFRALIAHEVEAFRRWLVQKGQPTSDEDIARVLETVYRRRRELDT
jgi:predicted HTH transcriptional regulator